MYTQPETIVEQYDVTVKEITKGRGTFLCDTKQGLRMLKPYHGSKEKAVFLRGFLAFLKEQGLEVEQIYLTKEDEIFSVDEQGIFYIQKDRIRGVECGAFLKEDIMACINALAVFHETGKNYAVELPYCMVQKAKEGLYVYEKHQKELKKVYNYIRNRKQKNDFEMKFKQTYPIYEKQASEAVAFMDVHMRSLDLEDFRRNRLETMPDLHVASEEDSWNKSFVFCHGDFNQHNVIKNKDGYTLINFEHLTFAHPMLDLGNYMRKILEKNAFDVTLGKEMLCAYDGKRRLETEEKRYLYGVLLFPEKFWKIANRYYNSHKAWISGRTMDKLDAMIAVEEKRSNFLTQIRPILLEG